MKRGFSCRRLGAFALMVALVVPVAPLTALRGVSAQTVTAAPLQVARLQSDAPRRLTIPAQATAVGNPPQLISANGGLTFNVSAQADPVSGDPTFVYNGYKTAPTLRLLPGDTLVVNLTNNLPVPPAGSGYTNATNLHYHGLHVSPQAPSDDSIDMLAAPGQTLHYVIKIPLDHPTGLYWYHSHAHGEAERQTLAGMSGALIIDGIAAVTPQIASLSERVLVLRDTPLTGAALPAANAAQLHAMSWAMRRGVAMHAELHRSSNASSANPYALIDPKYRRFVRPAALSTHCVSGNPEAAVKAITVNGMSAPRIRIAPGEKQFWRVVNAGADTYVDLQVDNTTLQIVALDGVPLAAGVGTPASMTVSHWVLPPASRVEFIISGPPAGTPAYMRTNCFDAGSSGDAMPAAVLAAIDPSAAVIAGRRFTAAARIAAPSARIAARSARVASAIRLRTAAITNTRTIYYSDQNTINGIAYDPAAPPQFYAQSGTVEEWTIVNNSTQVHTFHIHQVHFILEAVNGTPQAQQFMLDNVNVPAATASGPGSVKVLLDFTDPLIIGTFLVHCHILAHEDGGMMAKIRIGVAPPMTLSSTTVNFGTPSAGAQTVTIAGGAAPYSLSGCNGVASAAVNAASISIVPTAAGACVLTVADASSPSLTSTLTVAVGAAPAAFTLAPTSVSFSGPAAAAATVAITGGTAPFSVTGCGSIAAGTIAGQSLTVAPQAVGTCSLTISDANNNQAALAVSVNAAPVQNSLDVLTFHYDSSRSGWDQNETLLTAANVASGAFGEVGTLAPPAGMPGLGKVYAEPLYVTSELAGDGNRHNLILVAGAAGQVYAFDEATQSVVWHRSFTNAAAGIRQQLWSDTACADINPDDAIVGTPVIDRTRDAMYVVVATMENGVPYTRLHALGLGTGNDLIAPTVIEGSVALATGGVATISSLGNLNRPALLEANGTIYVGLGSHCDMNARSIHGWMLGYSASTLQQTGSLVDLSNANDGTGYYLGSPWMSGFGPAADAQGNIYFATGNGPFNGTTNFAMSVLKVPGNLNLGAASFFTPAQAAADSAGDADLAAGGVMLLPDQSGALPHLLVAGGKCDADDTGCFKYVLNRDQLGGQQNGNAGAAWSASTGGTLYGGPAYFVDATGAQHVVYGGYPLSTYDLTTGPVRLTVQSSTNVGCLECREGGGAQPVISSNGTAAGSAVVWALKTPVGSGGTISLYAFAPLAMGTTLFHAPAGTWTPAAGASYIGGALISPLVADGRVYVPSEGVVTVFGLTGTSAAARLRAASRSVRPLPAVPATLPAAPRAAVIAVSQPVLGRRAQPLAQRQVATVAPRAGSGWHSVAAGPHRFFGTIVALDNGRLAIRLRDGRIKTVDARQALAAGNYSAPLYVGKAVSVDGMTRGTGAFLAAHIFRVGNLANLAADR